MNPWDSWSADDWARHYAPAPTMGPIEHSTGDSMLDRAAQAARALPERIQERLQEGFHSAERQLQGVADAPGRFVSAVEMEAEKAARRLRQLADDEEAKVEKTVKVVAFAALGLFGLMALEGQKK